MLYRSAATVVHVTDGVPPWTPPDERDGVRVDPSSRVQPGPGSHCRAKCSGVAAGIRGSGRLASGGGDLPTPSARSSARPGPPGSSSPPTSGVTPTTTPATWPGRWPASGCPRKQVARGGCTASTASTPSRRLRFGWLPPRSLRPVRGSRRRAVMLEAKGRRPASVHQPGVAGIRPRPVVAEPRRRVVCSAPNPVGRAARGAVLLRRGAAVRAARGVRSEPSSRRSTGCWPPGRG